VKRTAAAGRRPSATDPVPKRLHHTAALRGALERHSGSGAAAASAAGSPQRSSRSGGGSRLPAMPLLLWVAGGLFLVVKALPYLRELSRLRAGGARK